jgi:hypothetical protein
MCFGRPVIGEGSRMRKGNDEEVEDLLEKRRERGKRKRKKRN